MNNYQQRKAARNIATIYTIVFYITIYICLWNIPYLNILFAIWHIVMIYMIIKQVMSNLKKYTNKVYNTILMK